jgi:hypothetical protein
MSDIRNICKKKARIDASGALHHIIAKGIDRNTIFQDDFDRKKFIDRPATILNETKTDCYRVRGQALTLPPAQQYCS